MPELQRLSNDSYQVLITASGNGYSRWKYWRADETPENGWHVPQADAPTQTGQAGRGP